MPKVKLAKLPPNNPSLEGDAERDREIEVISHGRVIGPIRVRLDAQVQARQRLLAARKHCRIGDITSPSGGPWNAESGPP